ncbi:MAG: DUF357 domain-containing protein [Candidatus Syntropharchaeia archaeon]
MSGVERIEKDIKLFEKNIRRAKPSDEGEKLVIERAEQYYRDTRYFLEKGDLLSAFGCINYAHGLVDALRIRRGEA